MKIIFISILFCLLLSCKSTQSKVNENSFSENMIELNLADRMDPQRISTSFKSLGVQYLCTVDKVKNICIYSFDTEQKSLSEILHFLGNEVGVEEAQKTKGCEH